MKNLGLFCAILLVGYSSAASAAWQQNWENAFPDLVAHSAVAPNGVTGLISNKSDFGIKFLDANGQTICQYALDPQRYYNSKASIIAGGTNRFLAFYLYRDVATSSIARMTVSAFTVTVPTTGQATCTPSWTWQTPFTHNDNIVPLYKGFFAKDGITAGLIMNDQSTSQTRWYSINPDTGVTSDTKNESWASFTDNTVGASENARYFYVSGIGTRARSVDPVTKMFGPAMLTSGYTVSASTMSDDGVLIEGTPDAGVKIQSVSPEYPAFLPAFTMPAPTNATFSILAGISRNGKTGAVVFSNAASTQLVLQSFTINIPGHSYTPINSFSSLSGPPYQNKPKQLLVLDVGYVMAALMGDAGTQQNVPELVILPRVGAATQFDAPGSAIDVSLQVRSLWVSFRAHHDNTAQDGSFVRKISFVAN